MLSQSARRDESKAANEEKVKAHLDTLSARNNNLSSPRGILQSTHQSIRSGIALSRGFQPGSVALEGFEDANSRGGDVETSSVTVLIVHRLKKIPPVCTRADQGLQFLHVIHLSLGDSALALGDDFVLHSPSFHGGIARIPADRLVFGLVVQSLGIAILHLFGMDGHRVDSRGGERGPLDSLGGLGLVVCHTDDAQVGGGGFEHDVSFVEEGRVGFAVGVCRRVLGDFAIVRLSSAAVSVPTAADRVEDRLVVLGLEVPLLRGIERLDHPGGDRTRRLALQHHRRGGCENSHHEAHSDRPKSARGTPSLLRDGRPVVVARVVECHAGTTMLGGFIVVGFIAVGLDGIAELSEGLADVFDVLGLGRPASQAGHVFAGLWHTKRERLEPSWESWS